MKAKQQPNDRAPFVCFAGTMMMQDRGNMQREPRDRNSRPLEKTRTQYEVR